VDASSCTKYGVGGGSEDNVKIETERGVVLVEKGVLGGSSLCGY
jgi:hypothetical protein